MQKKRVASAGGLFYFRGRPLNMDDGVPEKQNGVPLDVVEFLEFSSCLASTIEHPCIMDLRGWF